MVKDTHVRHRTNKCDIFKKNGGSRLLLLRMYDD